MTIKKHLLEAATLMGESAREDGAWKVQLISEGQGSSGFYSRELLEKYHSVFDEVLSFKNHPTGWDGPEARDFTEIVGEITGETWVENDSRGMAAIYGWYLPDPDHKDKIERYKSKLGVSIYAMGEGEFNEDTGNFTVTSFESDPYNSLDVVIAAGARGKFLESMRKVYEHRSSSKASTASVVVEKKEIGLTMDKEIEDRFAGIESLLQGLATQKQENAQAEADANAVQAEADKRVEAIVASLAAVESARADLLPSQVASLVESAKRGEDVAPAIESAKTIATEAREAFSKPGVETGRIGESLKSAADLGKAFG